MKKFLKELWEVYKPLRFAILGVLGFIAVSQVLNLLYPYLQSKIIDSLIQDRSGNRVYLLAGLAFLLWQFRGSVFRLLRERYELNYIDGAIKDRMQEFTLGKLFSFSIGQHTNENSGIKQSIVSRGENALEQMLQLSVYQALPLMVETIILTGVLLYFAPPIGVTVLLCIIVTAIFIWKLNMYFRKDFKEVERRYIKDSKFEGEVLRNIALVMVSAQEERAMKECKESQSYAYEHLKKTWLKFTNWAVIRDIIPNLARLVVLLIGAQAVMRNEYSVGQFVMFLTWSTNTLGNIGEMSHLHRQLIRSYSSIKRYFDMLSIEPDVKVIDNPVRPKKILGRIEFKDVTFMYPRRDTKSFIDEEEEDYVEDRKVVDISPALSKVSFIIEPGEKVAIVGESGSGKSTLIKALIRAQDPNEGQIIVDGNDLRILDLKRFRESIGLVDQEVILFDETLRYNITYGLNSKGFNITDRELREVSEQSRIDRFYNRLEKGFDTIIGEKGVKLSGGERQRVGIARALIKNPSILIFDEATSNLDSENEAMIREAIERVSRGRTTIIIAHRFSTIRNVDRILVFDRGHLVAEGKHQKLKSSCEQYQRLLKNQQ